ncbi:MAG: choice-of-anchor Q domain-containing protein, partial [Pseudomonadales bacterium]
MLGNFIGTNAAGTAIVGNTGDGIQISSGAAGNVVGGLVAGARNIIAGNDDGIAVDGTGSDGNTIIGNYLGTDVTGLINLGNLDDGIQVGNSVDGTIIGGTTAAARNVVASNADDGIQLSNSVTNSVVQGNYIGVGADGITVLANAHDGVQLYGGSSGNLVGGVDAGMANIIANNTGDGIAVLDAASAGNSFFGNAIYNNGGLGIDLFNDGVTANDVGDLDANANNLQNFPVITGAFTDASSTVAVAGKLSSTADSTFRLEFFANSSGDEGETYLGFRNVITNGSGEASFVESFNASVGAGQNITATATNLANGDTSEFSATTATAQAVIVDTNTDVLDGDTSSIANLLATKGSDGFISLREAVIATNNTVGHDSIFLSADTYTLSIAGTGENFAATGDLNIRDSLSLIGAGADSTIIDAADLDRVFQTYTGDDIFLEGLSIQNATALASGGALYASGTVTITDSVFQDNATAVGGNQGGAINNTGSLFLDGVRLTNNTSGEFGGALYNTGSAFITNSLIDTNTSSNSGGGIRNDGTLEIVNTTLDSNVAVGFTGGISNNSGSASLINVTISDSVGNGYASNTTTSMTNTIIAYSSLSDVIGSAVTSFGGNMIADGTGAGFGVNDYLGVDPLLAPLADFGGPTETRALRFGSPAENAGA